MAIKIETDKTEVKVYQNGVLLPAADAITVLKRLLADEDTEEGAALLRGDIERIEREGSAENYCC